MKPIVLSLVLMTAWFGLAPVSARAEEAKTISDHLVLAQAYEQKAAAEDLLIAEHQQMKKDYKDKFFVNEKVTSKGRMQEMETHCNAIIEDARKLQTEFLDFAKWHRMRAAELQGR